MNTIKQTRIWGLLSINVILRRLTAGIWTGFTVSGANLIQSLELFQYINFIQFSYCYTLAKRNIR